MNFNQNCSGQRYLWGIVIFSIFLISFSFQSCSRQITGASFAQKSASPVEIPTDAVLPEQPSQFANFNTAGVDRYMPLIKKYADQYGVDWVLILAVIKQESRFDHEAISHKGAYGLMQIMPLTQIELIEKLGVEETITPRNNIKAGIFHLKSLYSIFSNVQKKDRIRFTLAAYNAGIGRILDAQKIAQFMGNDPNKWSSIQSAISFLSKNSYTLHVRIWENGYPPSGYFRDWRQTIDYVDIIMNCYDRFSLALK